MSLFSLFRRPDFGALLREAEAAGGLVVDVRTAAEYRQGHVPGSVNIPLDRISGARLDKGAPLFVYCRSGARSGQACAILTQRGFEAVNIGGILYYHGELEQGGAEE